ncbi:MAG: helix-turn-helix domain-containing protein [Actinobacteria bacterium]|nr:helix-turn-helix domain-containing protein [Actinomycetota bacterium]
MARTRHSRNDRDSEPYSTFAPVLYRIEEAMDLLRLSRTQIYREMDAGRLRSVNIGRARRVPRKALEDYVSHLEQNAVALPH